MNEVEYMPSLIVVCKVDDDNDGDDHTAIVRTEFL